MDILGLLLCLAGIYLMGYAKGRKFNFLEWMMGKLRQEDEQEEECTPLTLTVPQTTNAVNKHKPVK